MIGELIGLVQARQFVDRFAWQHTFRQLHLPFTPGSRQNMCQAVVGINGRVFLVGVRMQTNAHHGGPLVALVGGP